MWRYKDKHIDYVRSIAKGRYNDEMADMFNKKFNSDRTTNMIRSLKKNHRILSGKLPKRPRPGTKIFTDAQEKFLKENAVGLFSEELTDLVNREFDLKIKVSQVKSWKARNKVNSGLKGHFIGGQEPWNKGMKGLFFEGSEKGWFEKGQRPLNYRPIGSERIDKKDGYTLVKVSDEGSFKDMWRHKQVLAWEKHNGKISAGHVVIFLDRNKKNTNIENLELISRAELVRMNHGDLFSSDPEVTKTGINLVRLNNKITKIDLKGGDVEQHKNNIKVAERNGINEVTFIARLKRGWNVQDAMSRPLHSRKAR